MKIFFDQRSKCRQLFRTVVFAGNEYVGDAHILALPHAFGKEFFVRSEVVRLLIFDVDDEILRRTDQLRIRDVSVRFKATAYPLRMQSGNEGEREPLLQKRLSARKGHAAPTEITLVPFQPRNERIYVCHSTLLKQRFGVMTEWTAQIAPRKKYHAPQPLAIHARAAVNRIDIPDRRCGYLCGVCRFILFFFHTTPFTHSAQGCCPARKNGFG